MDQPAAEARNWTRSSVMESRGLTPRWTALAGGRAGDLRVAPLWRTWCNAVIALPEAPDSLSIIGRWRQRDVLPALFRRAHRLRNEHRQGQWKLRTAPFAHVSPRPSVTREHIGLGISEDGDLRQRPAGPRRS